MFSRLQPFHCRNRKRRMAGCASSESRASPRRQGARLGRPVSELEAEALRGSREAWDLLIVRHTPRVVLSLLAMRFSAARAREVTADAWTRLVDQQRRGRIDVLELPGLAIAQARFLALEERRTQRAASSAQSPIEAAVSVPDPSPSPEDRVLSAQQLERAQRALSACSDVHQRVFRMVYGGNAMTQTAVAGALDLSVERVRHILTEVRKKLRAIVEEESHV
jgi:RNA polymerase sigma factor (sigma-70 family)